MPEKIGNVLSWGSDVEHGTIEQAAKASRLPFVKGHLALMPDAHVGMGATIGSVIPTQGAIIPAAIGVDIGCGMIAAETDLTADGLPDDLDRFLGYVERVVPAGVGKGHNFAKTGTGSARPVEVPTYAGASDRASRCARSPTVRDARDGQPLRRGLPRRARPRLGRAALRESGDRQPAGHAAHRRRRRG